MGEAGVIVFDKCELFQITNYKDMKVTEQVAYFSNGKIFKKHDKQWIRIDK